MYKGLDKVISELQLCVNKDFVFQLNLDVSDLSVWLDEVYTNESWCRYDDVNVFYCFITCRDVYHIEAMLDEMRRLAADAG